MKKLVSLVYVFFMGTCVLGNLCAETQPADTERYGPYPTTYKEIVMKWLDTQLIDAGSARYRVDWRSQDRRTLGTNDKPLSGLSGQLQSQRSKSLRRLLRECKAHWRLDP
jgi:hypothetical protein